MQTDVLILPWLLSILLQINCHLLQHQIRSNVIMEEVVLHLLLMVELLLIFTEVLQELILQQEHIIIV